MRRYVCKRSHYGQGHARHYLPYPYHLCCLTVSKRPADFLSRLILVSAAKRLVQTVRGAGCKGGETGSREWFVLPDRRHQAPAAPTRLYANGRPGGWPSRWSERRYPVNRLLRARPSGHIWLIAKAARAAFAGASRYANRLGFSTRDASNISERRSNTVSNFPQKPADHIHGGFGHDLAGESGHHSQKRP